MKQRLTRPTAALFPTALLAGTIMGAGQICKYILLTYFILQLFSLCPADSFRNAASREPGVKRVDRRFSGCFAQTALGLCAGSVVCLLIFRHHEGSAQYLPICAVNACIIIEQLFEERMFALSHPHDGLIMSVISNGLLLAGLAVDRGGAGAPFEGFYSLCAAGVGMIISIATAYSLEPMRAFSLKPVNIGFFPKAAAQSLTYLPLAAALIGFEPPLFTGWILWRLARTVCRRSADESRPLNFWLTAACGAMLILSAFVGEAHEYASACMIALLCAEAVYCAPGWRLYAGTALLIGGWVLGEARIWMNGAQMYGQIILSVLALAATILNAHKAFLRKV